MYFEEVVRIDETQGFPVAIVQPHDEITMQTFKPFKNTLGILAEQGPYCVVIDLTHVNYIDSIGFGMIVNARRMLIEKSGGLVLSSMNTRLRQIYEFLGLKSVLPNKFTTEAAVDYFSYKKKDIEESLKRLQDKIRKPGFHS